ncbi:MULTISPECIES: hypothetical protein [Thalassospira]|uniref:N-acetylglucosamine-6-phosphate deacetylase n=2 Tax=Thalassospira TaxID=168934 RepID=A0A367W490_9PROT|nr:MULTISPECIES: hypothetical protein [Thalassospira]MDG4719708.1 hypothetical protein [Thalassospira sp. FZY0004]RCK36254.1 hypothetical protein TH19_13350 [Thalassospira profundimaris]
MRKIFINADIYTHEQVIPHGYIDTVNGKIETIGRMDQVDLSDHEELIDITNHNLSAGWMDLQVNGIGNTLFENVTNGDGIEEIGTLLRQQGTTSWFGALTSVPSTKFNQIKHVVQTTVGKFGFSGVHVEGPWINPDFKGGHPSERIKASSEAHVEFVRAVSLYCPVIATVAPEIIPYNELQDLLSMSNVTVLAGHTDCSWVKSSPPAIHGCTHLFNGMPPLSSRMPHALGWLIGNRSRMASIIADGRHLQRETIQVLKRACWPDQVFLVSDIMPSDAIVTDGIDCLEDVMLDKTDSLVTKTGTIGGANSSIQAGLKFMVQKVGVPMASAINMVTTVPAALVGREQRLLMAGHGTDLVSFDNQFNVKETHQLN